MKNIMIKTFLLGIFSFAFFSCDNDEPTGGNPAEKYLGIWGICFDSVKCESVRDDGYMISAYTIRKVEYSGFENTEFQSVECEKCAIRNFDSWKYETVTVNDYSLQGDSISFSMGAGEDITITHLNPGRIVKATIHFKKGDVDRVITEHWTRLSGSFTLLN